jgi:CheY-like chemotaxis protein
VEQVVDKKVLVVDDIPINSKILVMHLKKLGITADVAVNGKEAVEAVKKNSYVLILMDLDMPVMDGYTATRHIREFQKPLTVRTPILAMSSFDRVEDKKRCIEEGMDGFVNKGLTPNELLTCIDSYMHGELPKTGTWAELEHRLETTSTGMSSDLAELEGRFAGSAQEIGNEFVFAMRGLLEEFEEAMDTRDPRLLTHAAYTVKGACSNVGMNTMARLCTEIADDGYAARWSEAQLKFAKLLQLLQTVQTHLLTIASTAV